MGFNFFSFILYELNNSLHHFHFKRIGEVTGIKLVDKIWIKRFRQMPKDEYETYYIKICYIFLNGF